MVFGFGKKSAGVGCYGKLPLFGDYVSHASDGAEARRLTGWLDTGYRQTGGDDDVDAAETLFVLPSGKRALFGALWPSADASGTRRFPFAVFGTASGKELARLGSGIPLALAPLWFRMTSAFPALREAAAPDALGTLLDEMSLPPDLPEIALIRVALARDSEETADTAGAAEVLFDLHRLAAMLSGGKKGVPAFAVMVPLRTGYAPELEAAAWLEVLVHRLSAPELPGASSLFLRPGRGDVPGALFVIHREIRDEDLGFLLSPTEDYAYANVLGDPGEDPDAAAFRDHLVAELGPAPTLARLMAWTG